MSFGGCVCFVVYFGGRVRLACVFEDVENIVRL